MKISGNSLFNLNDRLQMASLNFRTQRGRVISSNIANAETPGFRALAYDFEKQLQEINGNGSPIPMKTTSPLHKQHSFAQADGSVEPDVYIAPTESVSHDGNTVDVDKQMAELSKNQILYNGAVEALTRKIGLLKYAIHGGHS